MNDLNSMFLDDDSFWLNVTNVTVTRGALTGLVTRLLLFLYPL